MTTIYVPETITSTEQAEGLPPGTPVIAARRDEPELRIVAQSDPERIRLLLFIGYTLTALVPRAVDEIRSEAYATFHLMEGRTATEPFTAYVTRQEES